MLSEAQVERYSRQIILPQIGGRGQAALLSATVTIGGSGDVASTAAVYLAVAGIGELRVAPLTAAAVVAVNPDCGVETLRLDGGLAGATAAVRGSAAVVCADAAADTCALLNGAAMALHLPLIFGDAAGRLSVCADGAPCYRCLSVQLGQQVSAAPSLRSVTAGLIGTLLATEVIKRVLRLESRCAGRLLTFDILSGDVHDKPVMNDPQCPACGARVRRREC